MERSFIIPIAVAAGVHSMLFISGTPTTNPPPPERPKEVSIYREIPLPPIEPEEVVSDEPVAKASENPPPPGQPDVPSPSIDPRAISQVINPRDMIPRPNAPGVDRISTNWMDDVDNSRRKGSPLLTRDLLDNSPSARFQPAPQYPADLKSTEGAGTATVMFSVDVQGEVFNATVTRASHSRFGDEALRAVRRWRFDPGIKDGKRVPFRMVQTFSFTLSN